MKLPQRYLVAALAATIAIPAIAFAAKADRKKNDTAATSPAFGAADKDGDGFVTESEYIAAQKEKLGEDGAKTQFGKLDKDANGKLSKDEFGGNSEQKKKRKKKKDQ